MAPLISADRHMQAATPSPISPNNTGLNHPNTRPIHPNTGTNQTNTGPSHPRQDFCGNKLPNIYFILSNLSYLRSESR